MNFLSKFTIHTIKTQIKILLLCIVITIIAVDFTEDLSMKIIVSTYKSLTISTDDLGIPHVDYGLLKKNIIKNQKNPVAVSQTAFTYYDKYQKGSEKHKQLFLNCADWLINNSRSYEGYSILEYEFPLPPYNMTPPWRSGMAQGQALQVLVKAHAITHDLKYLECAQKLLNSFFVEVENGGVTYKTLEDGWWYEECADEGGKISKILNGHMFALLGIQEYYKYTQNKEAKDLFELGILSLKRSLPEYDKDGYSYYDALGHPSRKYHQVHIDLLASLYEITNEEIIKQYYTKWNDYKKRFFFSRVVKIPTKEGLAILILNYCIIYFSISIFYFLYKKSKS